MWRLFYPLRYFSLVNREKRHLDLWPTLLVGIFLALPFALLPGASFFRPDGFLDKVLSLITALTGFYVAALVAAATFNHPDLDKTITVGSIALVRKGEDGRRIQDLLTRREFACTIFGYLAFATLALSITSAAAVALSGVSLAPFASLPWVGPAFAADGWRYLRAGLVLSFTLPLAHIAVVTSIGLYYLMDRLYRQEPRVTAKKPDREAA
jgi:hypothetical protein